MQDLSTVAHPSWARFSRCYVIALLPSMFLFLAVSLILIDLGIIEPHPYNAPMPMSMAVGDVITAPMIYNGLAFIIYLNYDRIQSWFRRRSKPIEAEPLRAGKNKSTGSTRAAKEPWMSITLVMLGISFQLLLGGSSFVYMLPDSLGWIAAAVVIAVEGTMFTALIKSLRYTSNDPLIERQAA